MFDQIMCSQPISGSSGTGSRVSSATLSFAGLEEARGHAARWNLSSDW